MRIPAGFFEGIGGGGQGPHLEGKLVGGKGRPYWIFSTDKKKEN